MTLVLSISCCSFSRETGLRCVVGGLQWHDVGVELPRRVKYEFDGVRDVGTSTL